MEGEPLISVGILTSPSFELEGVLSSADIPLVLNGEGRVSACGDGLAIEADSGRMELPSGVVLSVREGTSFVIRGVTVGIQFHWQHKEDLRFAGGLRLLRSGPDVVAINVIGLEKYLASVISSEMSANCSMNFLKAHAIASRSWLLAQLERSTQRKNRGARTGGQLVSEGRLIRWYDREEHTLFDVCADDHCQRYQGVSAQHTPGVRRAVEETRGQVLRFAGKVCDARFSKSCGGITEPFHQVWQRERVDYLMNVADTARGGLTDVSAEEAAREWILSRPEAYCNTNDRGVLSQVLSSSDQKTTDFFRWNLEYSQEELSELIGERTGTDFGAIRSLVALERGPSGRISLLEIAGENQTLAIGKELEIRRVLSRTHLYSSAFLVEMLDERGGIPRRFRLHGAGWGHGVGMCQIGAALMGEKGHAPEAILKHYFTGAEISALY